MVIGGFAGLARTCLVMGTDAELIHHLLFETFNLSLGSRVGGLRHFDPVSGEFVLHLNGVMSNRSATIVRRLRPFQGHADVVVVENLWLARLAGLVCRERIT